MKSNWNPLRGFRYFCIKKLNQFEIFSDLPHSVEDIFNAPLRSKGVFMLYPKSARSRARARGLLGSDFVFRSISQQL